MLLAVSLVSAGVLAFEVLLMRLLAIVQWHHFAYMVISIALLGYGASGTFLSLAQKGLKRHFSLAFAANAILFGISAPAAFAVAQRLPFNALEIVWDPGQLLYLLALYMIFLVPFFFGANCVGLAFTTFGRRIGRIYRYDLMGAGLGAVGVVAALFLLAPADCLRLVSGLGLAAGGVVLLARAKAHRRAAAYGLLALAVVFPFSMPEGWIRPRLSEYKGLRMALDVPGTEVLTERSSPLGVLSVVRSPTIPFRHVPGLSLVNPQEPPDQLGVFTDGDSLSVVTAVDSGWDRLRYLGFTTSALPYYLVKEPSVLILGSGGGSDVLQALYHSAKSIDAVELNPDMIDLVARELSSFAGRVYDRPGVRVHLGEARGFVRRSQAQWDVVQIPLLDSFGAAAAGVQGLSESYLYTVEAFREYIRHLTAEGILAITRWLKLPPRDSLRLFATALVALRQEATAEPARHLVLIRGPNTTTLLVGRSPFNEGDLDAIRAFAAERSFDIAYAANLAPAEANRFNILDRAHFFDATRALASASAEDFLRQYKFDVTPTTDDQPYFFDFFRWHALPEFLELRTRGGAGLLEWGYLILTATLLQAVALSVLLILLPLWIWKGRPAREGQGRSILVYFLCLGLGFLCVEIAFIQRFIVFLSHPLYAISVVLSTFLVFAGLGSGYAGRLAHRMRERQGASRFSVRLSGIDLAVVAISGLALVYLVSLPVLFEWLIGWPDGAKVAVSVAVIAPLAFFMGLPFPLGLSAVSAKVPDLVPWAWGINGCASVISAVLATILAIHFGFTAVVVLAVVAYVVAALFSRQFEPHS
ncbi:MAG: hypothetical protein QNJ30_17780 [Kiloniellales bacterium]|nr:hypothetical protein [Kiloniellales bacterium]